MPIDSLIDYFNSYLRLDEHEIIILKEVFKERRIKKRQFLLQKGDINHFNTFIVTGCFRMYTVDENGKEFNLMFGAERSWIGDMESFYNIQPSDRYIESMEHSIVLQISRSDLTRLFVKFPKFNRIFRVITENELVSSQKRVLQNISLTAEERYQNFLQLYPQFYNRISNVQIASFLGITPEFLSMIRKRMVNS